MLNEQKLHFCDAKIAGLNNKAAALYAGYSQATASQQGTRLAKNPEIIKQIEVKTHLIATGQQPMPVVAGGRAALTSLPPQHHEVIKPPGGPTKPTGRQKETAPKKPEEAKENRFEQWRQAEKEQIKTVLKEAAFETPEDFLKFMMNNPMAQNKDRIAAAKALQSQENAAVKGTGKKAARKDDAAEAAKGRFGGMAPPPRLVANSK